MGRGIAVLFHDRSTRRGWVDSSTPRPQFTPGKDPVHIVQVVGWAPGPVWKGGKSSPNRDSIPDRPARSSVGIATELPAHITRTCACKCVQRLFLVHDYFCYQNEDDITNFKKEFWECNTWHETGKISFWQTRRWSLEGDMFICKFHFLYSTALYCTALYCTILYYTVLYCTVL